ncbi:MAG TPA: CxxC-x17-CxxC domain-containing protein [Patescibacteria group bacterium]|nr:CxxC-x17-CxxC domain-containing protein [Patescibacteria group bacterium]
MAFNRDRNRGGGHFSGGGRRDDRRERPQMFPATCSNCGKACEVPFRPTGDKPVLCRDCFRQNGGPRERRDDRPRFEPRHDGPPPPPPFPPHIKEELDSINQKVDKILDILLAATEMPEEIKDEAIDAVNEVFEDAPVEVKAKTPRKKTSKATPSEEV